VFSTVEERTKKPKKAGGLGMMDRIFDGWFMRTGWFYDGVVRFPLFFLCFSFVFPLYFCSVLFCFVLFCFGDFFDFF